MVINPHKNAKSTTNNFHSYVGVRRKNSYSLHCNPMYSSTSSLDKVVLEALLWNYGSKKEELPETRNNRFYDLSPLRKI